MEYALSGHRDSYGDNCLIVKSIGCLATSYINTYLPSNWCVELHLKTTRFPAKWAGLLNLCHSSGVHTWSECTLVTLILDPNHSLLSNKQNDTILTTAWLHISKDIVSFQIKIMEQMENNIILCNCLRWKRTFCLQSLILCLYAVA